VPNEWEEVYGEALRETDRAKVADACERARYTINERLTEMAAAKIAMEKEREQLHEALRELLLHQNRLQKPN
jgi:hypothetical protein